MNAVASALADLASRFDLRDIYVFGSRAGEIAGRVRGDGSDAPWTS
ncbi:MAG TPA: hypothetical protein VMN39_08580 [Longimicrobiaceae bacterium]|nr:hypothetical protein [Longimicrobiaceae bacterium]